MTKLLPAAVQAASHGTTMFPDAKDPTTVSISGGSRQFRIEKLWNSGFSGYGNMMVQKIPNSCIAAYGPQSKERGLLAYLRRVVGTSVINRLFNLRVKPGGRGYRLSHYELLGSLSMLSCLHFPTYVS